MAAFGFRKILFVAFIFSAGIFISSCNVNSGPTTETKNPAHVNISNNAGALSQRISMVNQPAGKGPSTPVTSNNEYTYLADVRTPAVRGRKLSATSVYIRNNYAFVSYQLHGVKYGGALDIIDFSDAKNPRIVSNLTFDDTDLNDVTVDASGSHAYVTGGRKLSSSGFDTSNGHHGAVVAEITIQNDSVLTSTIRETPLKSYSGNAVAINGNNIVVTTGGHGGGIYVLDLQNFTVRNAYNRDLARYVAMEGNTAVGMALNVGNSQTTTLYQLNTDTNQLDSLDTGLTVNPENGKNVIDFQNGLVYTALSGKGFKVFDFSHPSSPVHSFDLKKNGLANGLDATDSNLYMAAGSEGLYVAQLPQLTQIFHFDTEEEGSANYVASDDHFIFLAKGIDGLNILKKNTPAAPTACPFDAGDGTVVNFKNIGIRSDKKRNAAETDFANVSLSKGTYTVKLYGYDDHRNTGRGDRTSQNQPNESFFVALYHKSKKVAETGDLGDLPDDSNLGTKETTLHNFKLKKAVDKAKGIHSAYPSNNANSISAKCAAFKRQ